MLEQDLFSYTPPSLMPTLPYAKGSPTSREGAIKAAPKKHGQCERIMEALAEFGTSGANAYQLKQATGITQSSTMAARLNGLMHEGKIVDSGFTREAEDSGVEQIVWRLA